MTPMPVVVEGWGPDVSTALDRWESVALLLGGAGVTLGVIALALLVALVITTGVRLRG